MVLGEARALSTDDSIRTSLVSAEITIMKVHVCIINDHEFTAYHLHFLSPFQCHPGM